MKPKKNIIKVLNKIGSNLIVKNNEPQIKKKRDRFGNFYWQVYDYATNNQVNSNYKQGTRMK
jgi:hypothetical protein